MSLAFDPSKIPVPEGEGPESVWDLTSRIRDALESEFPKVYVWGEISNFKRHTSGHIFFTLKDERASLRAVMWKSAAGRLPAGIQDGVEVEVRGHIGVFEAAGNYQLYVSSIRPRGLGALEAAFRKLKEKLQAEGLFDPAHKRPLPRFSRRVGVVTSPTGAAIRDIINVLARRWPAVEIVIAPARVQGDGASAEIVEGLRRLNRLGGIDVIIIGRGGGSLEDLWPFNEEIVARAVYSSDAPVVSAVGHETDFSISDFVADVRAPTPSAAAELVVPDAREVLANLGQTMTRLARQMTHACQELRSRLTMAARSRYFAHPEELVLARVEQVDDLADRMAVALGESLADRRLRLERAAGALAAHSPRAKWQGAMAALRLASFRMRTAAQTLLVHRWKAHLDRTAGRLEDLGPDRVLARGYSRTVLERTGLTLTRAADAAAGEVLRTHLAEGRVRSQVIGGPGGAASAERPKRKTREVEGQGSLFGE